MTDLDWRPDRQWRWSISGMILGYFCGYLFMSAVEIYYLVIPLIGLVFGGFLGWYARFHEANFHEN